MENIIAGFDFSSGSANAVDLSIDIANRLQRDIRLVYVKVKDEKEAVLREEIERRIAAVSPLLKGIKMELTIRSGKVALELAAQAREDKASLIIVGTNGTSGFRKNWIGKNTYSTVTESEVPVLSLREGFNFSKELERIVLPIDSTAVTRQKVPVAMRFAQIFNSEIHVLGIYTSKTKDIRKLVDNYCNQVEKMLSKANIPCVVKMLSAAKDPTTSTLLYADQVNADLIVIMTEQEKAFTDWLLGSHAEQMLNRSTRPILSLRPEHISESR